jgi:hypothetical protein
VELVDAVGEFLYLFPAVRTLDGARSRNRLRAALAEAGFEVRSIEDHHDDLLAMRDRVNERIDYEGLLGLMGKRGGCVMTAIEGLEAALEAGDVSYAIVASANDGT